jgi:ATP-dependent RNA helicase RhlB
VAARGLDIEGLALVVNFDIPAEAENYVHRIGRTERAGKTGKAFTLASEKDVYELPDIERYIGKKIPSQIADASLYGEDKSEGVRIKTDFYDDRDGRGSGRGDGRRRESVGRGRGREGGGREHSREGGRISGARSSGGAGRARSPVRSDSQHDGHRRGRSGERGTEQSGAGQNEALRDGAATRGQVRGKPRNQEKPAARRDSGRPRTPNLSALSFDERMSYYKEKYSGNADAPDSAKTARKHSARRGGATQTSSAKPAGSATKAPAPSAAGTEKPKRGLLGAIKKLFGKKEE